MMVRDLQISKIPDLLPGGVVEGPQQVAAQRVEQVGLTYIGT